MYALTKPVMSGHKVLDLGAGINGAAEYLAVNMAGFNCDLTAMDFCGYALDVLKRRCPSITTQLRDTTDLFKDRKVLEAFDVVIAGELIEHMVDPYRLISDMVFICRRGGWLCLSTPNPQPYLDLNKDRSGIKNMARDYPEHLWAIDACDLKMMLSPHGETQVSTSGKYLIAHCWKGRELNYEFLA
jgi:2-polyprenyl-3-methyl-5-hydroxy-6-metoxy-1,4-benzoquinol methylase